MVLFERKIVNNQFMIWYRRFMIWYYGWRVKLVIRKMRRLGKKHGLPSLDQWSDEQVRKGIMFYYYYEDN